MKKILLILLCFILAVQPCIFAEGEEVVENYENSDMIFAKSLGLIPEDYVEDAPVTRIQLANVLTNIIAGDTFKDSAELTHPFTDCEAVAPSVAFVNSVGLMKGMGDNRFYPEEKVTYAQLIKTIIVFLGYEHEAVAMGGYPSGYLITASKLGITKSDAAAGDSFITVRKLASVLKLMQNVPVKERIIYGGKEEWADSNKNYLSLYKGIDRVRGMITAMHSTDVYSDATINFYDINIDDVRYKLSENCREMINMLGYKVDAYYKENDSAQNVIVYYEEYRNTILEISANDMISCADGEITYVLDEYKDAFVKLSDSAFVIYNGTPCFNYNDSILNPFKDSYLDGKVTLIDHNGDKKYDVISIDAFDTFVVSKNADGKIFNKYRPEIVLDINKLTDSMVEFTNILGQPIPVDYADEGDIVSVSSDVNGKVKRLVLTVDTYTGIVEEVEYMGKYPSKVLIGEDTYELSRSVAQNPQIGDLKPGVKVKLFFNKNSQVSDIEIGEYVEYYKGLLVDAAKEGAVEKTCKVKIFTAKDKFIVTSFAKQVIVNETDTMTAEEIYEKIASDVTADNRVVRKAILYSQNENQEINKIKISDDTVTKPNDILYMYKKFDGVLDRPQYKDTTKSFGNQLLINDGTAIFVMPAEENRDDEKAYAAVTPSYFEVYSTTPKFKAYGTDALSPLADILVVEGVYKQTLSSSYILVVDDIVKTTDEDNSVVYKVTTLRDGSSREYLVDEEDMIKDLSTGDVLRYATTKEGKLTNLTLVFDCSENKMPGSNPSSATFTASPRFLFGKVIYNNGVVFTVEITAADGTVTYESFPTSGFVYTKCNFRGGEEGRPVKGTAEDLFDANRHPGSESYVLVFTYSGGAEEIIIYNK